MIASKTKKLAEKESTPKRKSSKVALESMPETTDESSTQIPPPQQPPQNPPTVLNLPPLQNPPTKQGKKTGEAGKEVEPPTTEGQTRVILPTSGSDFEIFANLLRDKLIASEIDPNPQRPLPEGQL